MNNFFFSVEKDIKRKRGRGLGDAICKVDPEKKRWEQI